MTRFTYQIEKFSSARRALMLPHPNGEEMSIASAFDSCYNGLAELDLSTLDSSSRTWVTKLNEFMDTTGLSGSEDEGTYIAKARQMSIDDKNELSHIVDELADWFRRHSSSPA